MPLCPEGLRSAAALLELNAEILGAAADSRAPLYHGSNILRMVHMHSCGGWVAEATAALGGSGGGLGGWHFPTGEGGGWGCPRGPCTRRKNSQSSLMLSTLDGRPSQCCVAILHRRCSCSVLSCGEGKQRLLRTVTNAEGKQPRCSPGTCKCLAHGISGR